MSSNRRKPARRRAGPVDPSTRTTAPGRGLVPRLRSARVPSAVEGLARDSAPRAASKGPRALPVGLHQSIGCGIDVVELARFRIVMQRGGAAFMRRVFTEREAAYAKARRRTTLLHLAGRFAAKEAVLKAISQLEPTRVLAMNQVEVRNDRFGRPHILLHGRSTKRLAVHISLSHVDTVAVASAIAIGS